MDIVYENALYDTDDLTTAVYDNARKHRPDIVNLKGQYHKISLLTQ